MPVSRERTNPDAERDWTFSPEEELLASAGSLRYLVGPLRLASHALGAAIQGVQERGEEGLETAEAEAAALVLVLSFRVTRAVAVLTASGLTTEANVQIRRLVEFSVLAEHLSDPTRTDYARAWLDGKFSTTKLFKGDVLRQTAKYLAQGAHANARHFWDLSNADGKRNPWPSRDERRDILIPWSAACLTRDILFACERVLDFSGPGARVAQEIADLAPEVERLLPTGG